MMSMNFNVIVDRKSWNDFFKSYFDAQKDIYFDYSYHKAYELNGDGTAMCAVFVGANGMKLMYPFIKVKIPCYGLCKDYYDITSCYGYGGPLAVCYNIQEMKVFESRFHHWCVENNIVAEFVRFHPLLENHKLFERDIQVELNRQTVYVDLNRSVEELWKQSLTGKNRNQIRKALKSGVTIKETSELKSFLNIYNQTMQRLSADPYLFFCEPYFVQLSTLLPENMAILEAIFEDCVIAGAILLFMGNTIHYHLAGSLKEYLYLCPNNLLLFHAILFGHRMKHKTLHLGGGNSTGEDDSLFKFKKSFSPDRKNYYIGKRVHNHMLYDILIKKWTEKQGRKSRLFLQYEFI